VRILPFLPYKKGKDMENQNFKEFSIEEYLTFRNLSKESLRTDSFWKELPKNHQALMCMEGMLYGFLIRN